MRQLRNRCHGFDVPVGHIATTVRKGTGWAKVELGEELELWVCHKDRYGRCRPPFVYELVGTGRILGHWVGKLKDIPRPLLEIEHNMAARDYNTLKYQLKQAYGSITDDDIVTVLIYLRTS